MMKWKKTNKNKRIAKAILRLIKDLERKDGLLFMLALVYGVSYLVYDATIAFLPKLLLESVEKSGEAEMIRHALVFVFIGGAAAIIYGVIADRARVRISFVRIDYLAEAFNKIITCDYKYMEDSTFFNKYDSAFDACSNSESGIEKVYEILFEIPSIVGKALIFAIVICSFSPIVLIAAVTHVVIFFITGKKAASYKYAYKEELSRINRKKRYFNSVTQDFQYGKDIRLYSLQGLLHEKYCAEIIAYRHLMNLIKNKEYKVGYFTLATMIICDLAIYGSLLLKASNGITLANVTMYFIAVNMLMQALNKTANNVANLYGEGLYIADYFDFIDADLNEACAENSVNQLSPKVGIEIHNLNFKYPNTERYILRDINLSIAPGEKIAIVGENGTGKTTLIKVLIGLFREYEGEIIIGNRNARHMKNSDLFSQIAVVFQDVNILAYSIRENITGKCDDNDVNGVEEALAKVKLYEKVRALPKGIDSQVHKFIEEDGVEFSGGEYQRLALARAIYRNAKIIVLDEPTAAMDPLAEKNLYESFNEILEDTTVIFISHRLASTSFCDKIIYFDENGVAEQGTHQELMALKGKYYNMFMLQANHYQET